jgi:probable HAF family extracellular repeat protein
MNRVVRFASVCAGIAATVLGFSQVRYSLQDLSGMPRVAIFGVNRRCEICASLDVKDPRIAEIYAKRGGSYPPGDNSEHAFLYSKGKWVDLGTLGGGFSMARGLNDSGDVVGVSDTHEGDRHAFLYSKGKMRDLGTLGGRESEALDVNNRGQIVGWSLTAAGVRHPFLYAGGKLTDLGPPEGLDYCSACIDESGRIAGVIHKGDSWHTFRYPAGAFSALSDSETADITGISRSGSIIGRTAGRSERWSSFVIRANVKTIIDDFWAFGVNARGQVVGESIGTDADGARLYYKGKLLDLNDLLDSTGAGWFVQSGYAINDAGLIVAEAYRKNGMPHVVLLTPSGKSRRSGP